MPEYTMLRLRGTAHSLHCLSQMYAFKRSSSGWEQLSSLNFQSSPKYCPACSITTNQMSQNALPAPRMWGAWPACTTQAQTAQSTAADTPSTIRTAASACAPFSAQPGFQTVPARANDMQMGAATFVMARMAAGMDQMPSPAMRPDAAAGTCNNNIQHKTHVTP